MYHFTVANTRFAALLTRRGKTKFATVKWYNLCLQIIQSQTYGAPLLIWGFLCPVMGSIQRCYPLNQNQIFFQICKQKLLMWHVFNIILRTHAAFKSLKFASISTIYKSDASLNKFTNDSVSTTIINIIICYYFKKNLYPPLDVIQKINSAILDSFCKGGIAWNETPLPKLSRTSAQGPEIQGTRQVSFSWHENLIIIMAACEEYARRWAKKEDVEVDALSEWLIKGNFIWY